jgi:acyl-CoA thioesterase YciA
MEKSMMSTAPPQGATAFPSEPRLTTRARIMIADLNPDRNGYGAVLADFVDTASTDAALWVHGGRVATRNLCITFIAPVKLADFISTWTTITKVGTTSISIHISVKADRIKQTEDGGIEAVTFEVATAEVVFVAVDETGANKVPVNWKGTDRSFVKPPEG